MDLSTFSHIHILPTSTAEELYLISSGAAPSTSVILINQLISNNAKAFQANITAEVIEEWNTSNEQLSRVLFLEQVSKALIGQDDSFSFQVIYKHRVPHQLVLVNYMDRKNPNPILECTLEEVELSQGLRALSRTGINSGKMSQQSNEMKSQVESLRKEISRLKKRLDDLNVSKAQLEDSHFRTFRELLNGKKVRNCELRGIPYMDQQHISRRARVNSSNSEENNTSDENWNGDDFDRDTQIEEEVPSPVPMKPNKKPVKSMQAKVSQIEKLKCANPKRKTEAKKCINNEIEDTVSTLTTRHLVKNDVKPRTCKRLLTSNRMDESDTDEDDVGWDKPGPSRRNKRSQGHAPPKSSASSETGDEFNF